MSVETTPLVALADYQLGAVRAIRDSVLAAARYSQANPGLRQSVARRVGATLLQAPTGSGKTLMLGRALEEVRGKTGSPTAWFWFAPFSGLVAQTRDALAEQCPSLRLRDVARDRSALMTRDGDVFVQTWALVATTRKDARKVRSRGEDAASLDDMLADLRDRGVRIGVVIDEAHLNFGTNARAAADFYLNVLRPDFTLLATATPNDDKLEAFEAAAGVTVENRVVVARDQVVKARLNKVGLTLGVVRLDGRDAALIDPEQAALTIAWKKHRQIKARLAERGVAVTPLMLVQVEDQAKGGADPIARVRDRLIEITGDKDIIATHTSGEPDPDFHTLAYDPSREILVFKVSAATGFDAPRAWTLVSVRPTRGTTFGLQVVGRIMRVHPKVRGLEGDDPLLDRGWVYLTDPDLQEGLDRAAEEMKAVRASIATIADELEVLEFTSEDQARMMDARRAAVPHAPSMPRTDEERQARLDDLIAGGFVDASLRELEPAAQDRLVVQAEWTRSLGASSLFGTADLGTAPSDSARPRTGTTYPLRVDRGVPTALLRERPPSPDQLDGAVVARAARAVFQEDRTPFDYLLKTQGQASVSLRDLFVDEAQDVERFNVRMSEARIAELAQASFEFNDAISAPVLKRALVEEFRRLCDERGFDHGGEKALRRAVELFALNRPSAIPDALKLAQAGFVDVGPADAIPPLWINDGETALPSRLGAYAVFPPNMNGNERRFAELLDADDSGVVKWWLRLQENASWAVTLVLPNGKRFFPDFAVGVAGRATPDAIALIETKDDGVTGRLHGDLNREKIRARHREYRNVRWTYEGDGRWEEAGWHPQLERIEALRPFSVDRLVVVE